MVFIYAFIGVLCLGLAPLFGKAALATVNPLTAFALRTMIAAFLVAIWFGYSRGFSELFSLSPYFWITITIEAILAALLGDLAYFYALKHGNLNEVSIIMSCAPLITILLSYFFLDEEITLLQFIGACCITLGLIFISLD